MHYDENSNTYTIDRSVSSNNIILKIATIFFLSKK